MSGVVSEAALLVVYVSKVACQYLAGRLRAQWRCVCRRLVLTMCGVVRWEGLDPVAGHMCLVRLCI